jgi:phage gpG-like protein
VPKAGVTHFKILIFGDEKVRRQLLRGAAVAADMRPTLNEIADDMMNVVEATFTGQGRRYGGSWKALEPATIRRKLKKGQDSRILIATGAMMDSMTKRGDENQHLVVTADSIELSSNLDYPEVHQKGKGHMPQRKFIQFYSQDRKRWSNMVKADLMAAMSGV